MTKRLTIAPLGWAIWATGTVISTAAAVPPDLVHAVPTEAWAVVIVTGGPSAGPASEATGPGSPLETAAFLLDHARRMGFAAQADTKTRLLIDAAASWPVIWRHPCALCVLEADVKPFGEGGYRLTELQAGLIVQTAGRNADIEARIQHLLHVHVDSQSGRIETIRDGAVTSYRLIDRRLPAWAQMRWGAVEGFYVLALGPGAFEQIAAAIRGGDQSAGGPRAGGDDAWLHLAHTRCRGDAAVVEWAVRFDRIREHLKPVMAGRPDEVIEALGLGDVQRGLWAVGSVGRAVEAHAVLRRDDMDQSTPICVVPKDPWIQAAVPPQATHYAAIDYSPRELVLRARDAYLASRSPSTRANLRNLWAKVEAETGVRADRDLLQQLGQWIVIHDDPPSPLSLPLARTVLVEISGSSAAVRAGLDRLLERYRQHLVSASGRPGGEPGWFDWQLKRDPDGVWYLQAGIYGPALAVTEQWIVISYSPVAVRRNLAYLKRRAAQPIRTGRTSAATQPAP